MKTRTPLRTPPETLAQAQHWQTVKNRYIQLGLCEGCAAQAAWGHQCGFSAVHPPCDGCAQTIADWPVAKPNGWRTRGGNATRSIDDATPQDFEDQDGELVA